MKRVGGLMLAGVVVLAGCSGSDAADEGTGVAETAAPVASDAVDTTMVEVSEPATTMVEVTEPAVTMPADTMPVMTAAPVTTMPVVYEITPEMKDWQVSNATNLSTFGQAMTDLGVASRAMDLKGAGVALAACVEPAAAMAESAVGVLPVDADAAMQTTASLCQVMADAAAGGDAATVLGKQKEFEAALGVLTGFLTQLTVAG